MLLNVYVPNAGKKDNEAISERADLKIRFLHALKEKCDSLREEGKKVKLSDPENRWLFQKGERENLKTSPWHRNRKT